MSPKLYRFLKAQRWTVIGLLLSVIALVPVSVSFLAESIYFNDPQHKNVKLEAWMTSRYMALSYELPRPVVLEILGIEQGSDFPRRLDHLAESLGMTLEELTEKMRAAKAAYQEQSID